LWQWRDAQRRGKLVAEASGFLPLRIVPEMPAPGPQGPVAEAPVNPENQADSRIEIVLPDGTAVRVAEGISAAALRRVMAALRG
jgi:transposase